MAKPRMTEADLQDAWDVAYQHQNITMAAQALGVNRSTIQSRINRAMERLKLDHPVHAAETVKKASFTAPNIPHKERELSDLLVHKRAEGERAKNYEEAIKLIPVKLHTPGPVGFMAFGDPHIDSDGCDFALLESHLKIAAARKEYVFAGNIGDLRDNWIGRLERLYATSTVSARETWKLVEWMMQGAGVHWTWLVRGNHDAWAGVNDPLDWISKGAKVGVDGDAGVRIAFVHPNGAVTRGHFRHDFPGNSMYNPLHALKREMLYGFRDHMYVAGHRHIGADAKDINGDGMPFVMVRICGYKVSDAHRQTLGLKAKPLHPAAMIIVDPDEPDNSITRVWTAPSVEEGADYLDFKRNRWNTRSRKTKR